MSSGSAATKWPLGLAVLGVVALLSWAYWHKGTSEYRVTVEAQAEAKLLSDTFVGKLSAADPWTCVALSASLDDGRAVLDTSNGRFLTCDDVEATYRFAGVFDGGSHDCGRYAQGLAVDGKTYCLERVFRVGQCVPISTPTLAEDEVQAALSVATACDASRTNEYPGIAKIIQILPVGKSCKNREYPWPTASPSERLCMDSIPT